MNFNWYQTLTWPDLINLIDILIVWFCIYKLMRFLSGTKAVQLFRGLTVIVIAMILSWYLGLNTIFWIMNQIVSWGVIVLAVVFQPEIRRGLEHLGRGSGLGFNTQANDEEEIIKSLDKALQYMSKRKIGALIAIQMETGLDDYIETGITLNAQLSSELLINIFIPNTPLHDGAVIMRGREILAAAAYLPLSQSNLIPKEWGTRHRAAVGMSESNDSIIIVISEETGEISIMKEGSMHRNMDQDSYLRYFKSEFLNDDADNKSAWTNFINYLTSFFKSGGRK